MRFGNKYLNMNKELVYNDLVKIVDAENVKMDEPMKKHISFRVGGPADILVRPTTEEQLAEVLKYMKITQLKLEQECQHV